MAWATAVAVDLLIVCAAGMPSSRRSPHGRSSSPRIEGRVARHLQELRELRVVDRRTDADKRPKTKTLRMKVVDDPGDLMTCAAARERYHLI